MVNGYSAGQSDILNAPSSGFEKSQVNIVSVFVSVFVICKSWLGRSRRWNAYAVNAYVSQLVYTENMIHTKYYKIASVLRVELQI